MTTTCNNITSQYWGTCCHFGQSITRGKGALCTAIGCALAVGGVSADIVGGADGEVGHRASEWGVAAAKADVVVIQSGVLAGAPDKAFVGDGEATVVRYATATGGAGGCDVGHRVDGYGGQAAGCGELFLLAIGGATVVGGIGSDIVDIVGLEVGHIAGEGAVALPHSLMVSIDCWKIGGAPADAAFGDIGAAVGSDIAAAGGAGGCDIGNIGSGDGRQIKTSSLYCYLVAAIVGDHMQDGAIGSTSQTRAVNGHRDGDGLARRDGVGDVGHRGIGVKTKSTM